MQVRRKLRGVHRIGQEGDVGEAGTHRSNSVGFCVRRSIFEHFSAPETIAFPLLLIFSPVITYPLCKQGLRLLVFGWTVKVRAAMKRCAKLKCPSRTK
jgi:hypothetical protein